MNVKENRPVLGVIAEETAMYELLAKFLVKEGYEVRRASQNTSPEDDLALIVYAPTRDCGRSKDWFDELIRKKRVVLVVQCCDEDFVDLDDNVVVMSERPLNLRQLSNTIGKTIGRHVPNKGSMASVRMNSVGSDK